MGVKGVAVGVGEGGTGVEGVAVGVGEGGTGIEGVAVGVGVGAMVKLAVTVLSPSMVIQVTAALGLATSPVQPSNCQPSSAMALIVTIDPSG